MTEKKFLKGLLINIIHLQWKNCLFLIYKYFSNLDVLPQFRTV